jgi:hypothetical protein
MGCTRELHSAETSSVGRDSYQMVVHWLVHWLVPRLVPSETSGFDTAKWNVYFRDVGEGPADSKGCFKDSLVCI